MVFEKLGIPWIQCGEIMIGLGVAVIASVVPYGAREEN